MKQTFHDHGVLQYALMTQKTEGYCVISSESNGLEFYQMKEHVKAH